MLSGIGSAIGVGTVGEAASGLIIEEPENSILDFNYYLVLKDFMDSLLP